MTFVRLLGITAVLVLVPIVVRAADAPAANQPVSYSKQIRPLFAQHCQGCHQPAKPLGGYIMTEHKNLLAKTDSDDTGVVPGKPEKSKLVEQILPHSGKAPAMPKGRDPLAEADVTLIKKWIAEGARDDTPMSARQVLVDADHPPVYALPPVLRALDYSPDGRLLAVSGHHEVLLHRADGSGLVARLIGLSEHIESLAFSPDGRELAVTGGSPGRFGEVQVWDVEKEKLRLSVSVTYDTVFGVSWSPDGSKLAFGCADNSLRAIDAATGKQVLYQGAHSDWVLGTAFSTDGRFLVSCSRDRTLKLTEVATQRFIDNVTSITPGALKGGLAAVARRPFKEKRMVKAANIAVASTEEKVYDELLIGGSDGTPRIYKMHREVKRVIGDDANKVREFEPLAGRLYTVAFNGDGSLLAAGSSYEGKGEVRVYNANDGKRISTLEGQKGRVYAVKFSPDGKTIASAGYDTVVRLHDPLTGALIKEFLPVPLAK